VTAYDVPPGAADPVPIGAPTPGDRVYLVDRLGRLVPPGAVGEVWIGGEGVARGYRGRPDLTAAAFGDDPFAPGGRVYRTGDLARWRADGTLDFLGRRDGQVKLRGHRIELAEIETVLREHPAVADAAVTLVTEGVAEAHLAAHLAASDGGAGGSGDGGRAGGHGIDLAGVQEYVRARLPAAMVPLRWQVLAALPRTVTDKVDRRALAASLAGTAAPAGVPGTHVPPATEMESFVAEIWAEVLGVERIGATDDFFALGGRSLGATRVAARLRDQLEVDVPARALFDRPDLRGYAAHVEALLLADLAAEGAAGADGAGAIGAGS
jgi:hypothetical protein